MSAVLARAPDAAEIEGRATRLTVALATVIARPLDHIDPEVAGFSRLPSAVLARMGIHPAFRPAVNRAVSRELRLGELAIDRDVIGRLRTKAATRLATLLVSEPAARVRTAATMVAAAVLHRHVVGFVMRADRERVREVLGDTAFRVAVQEAPLLHAPLADLEGGWSGRAALAAGATLEAARTRVAAFGAGILGRYIAAEEPALVPLHAARWPAEAEPTGHGPLADVAREHVFKLLRRRMDPWAAIIG